MSDAIGRLIYVIYSLSRLHYARAGVHSTIILCIYDGRGCMQTPNVHGARFFKNTQIRVVLVIIKQWKAVDIRATSIITIVTRRSHSEKPQAFTKKALYSI